MKSFNKILALGAVLAASSSVAFADTFNLTGYTSYNQNTTTITFEGPYSSAFDTGVFSGLNSGAVNFVTPTVDYGTTGTYSAELFTIAGASESATFTGTGDTFSYANNFTIDETGYFTLSDGSVVNGVLDFTTQELSGSPVMTNVSFSATEVTAVTPEPNSLVLMGTGLLAAAGMLFMRRRNADNLI